MFARLLGLSLLATTLLAAPAAAEPALWKLTGPHATVYLFGTVHVLRKDVVWRSAKIDNAFKSAGTLVEEIKGIDDTAAMQPLILKYGVDAAHPLSTKLDAGGGTERLRAEEEDGRAERGRSSRRSPGRAPRS